MTRLGSLVVIIVLALYGGLCAADRLPAHYPDSFQITGILDRLDPRNGEIVIGDRLFRIDNNTAVHTLHAQNVSPGALTEGMFVGCNSINIGSGTRVVTDIWVLPDHFSGSPSPNRMPTR